MRKFIIYIILLAILEISLALYLTEWRDNFWQAVSLKQGLNFFHQLLIFSGVALTICFVSGASGYFVSLASIEWRKRLTERSKAIKHDVENINQRVQEDSWSYPDLMLTLGVGSVKAVSYIVIFSISIITMYGYVYLLYFTLYCIVGSYLTSKIARPLIELNYQQQRAEATYRNDLSITNFQDCIHIMLGLAKKQKHLTYFQQFYGQLGVIVPLLVIAPVYFTTGMTLGSLMRFNSLSSTVMDNLNYGVSSFAMINKLVSCRRRLLEAGII